MTTIDTPTAAELEQQVNGRQPRSKKDKGDPTLEDQIRAARRELDKAVKAQQAAIVALGQRQDATAKAQAKLDGLERQQRKVVADLLKATIDPKAAS